MMAAWKIRVTGSVQGVFFRAETKRIAEELEINGWVRNCDDESVEIHAEGTDEALGKLEEWCAHGPEGARVEKVFCEKTEPENSAEFSIKY